MPGLLKLRWRLSAMLVIALMATTVGLTQQLRADSASPKPKIGCPSGGSIVGCPVASDDVIRQQVGLRLRGIFGPQRGCVNVNVLNGVVYLTGTATDIADVELATFLASSVRGVSYVCNRLTLVPAIQRDLALVERVTRAIANAPYKISGVRVEVTSGIAHLTGWVDTEYVREQVGVIASSVPGIVAVHNYLFVKNEGGTF